MSFALLIGSVVAPASSGAAAAPLSGQLVIAYQYRTGAVHVVGFAYDRANHAAVPRVCLAVGARCVQRVTPNLPSPAYDRAHRITGRHRFAVTTQPLRPGVKLALRTMSAAPMTLAARYANSPGARAVAVAKRNVGARYTSGGNTPRGGFDCSGYTMYVYRAANVASLPHNTDAQRHSRYMHRVARAAALPGDIVFYLSGTSSYHVAIYAGHGYQYAAATPRDGVRYQPIWSTNVEFRTDWH
ncbi:MAG: C40 family peptidase [Jatrophihabitantaceae bacterium]